MKMFKFKQEKLEGTLRMTGKNVFFQTFALFLVQLISFRSKQLSRRFQDVSSHGKLYCFIFQAPKKVGKDEFSDILNAQGFKTTGDQEGEAQTLKALKKEQNKPLDPIRAKVTFPLLIFFFLQLSFITETVIVLAVIVMYVIMIT